MWQTLATHGRMFFDQMRLQVCILAIMWNTMCGINPTLPITPRIPFPEWSRVVAPSCCGDVFVFQQGLENWSGMKQRWMALNNGRSLVHGWRLTFQQGNEPKHSGKATLEWSKRKQNVLVGAKSSIQITVNQHNPSSLKELKQFRHKQLISGLMNMF